MSKDYTSDGSHKNTTDKTSMGTEKDNVYNGTVIHNEKLDEKEKYSGKSQLGGFLVSFSKTELGEFWALYEGNANVIGRSSKCQIKLNEETVSSEHAIINIGEYDNGYEFYLTDTNSKSGTILNGKRLRPTQASECKNLDKIKIGEYELMLIVIDKEKNELVKNDKFKSTGASNSTTKNKNDEENSNPYDNVYTKI